MKFPSHFAENNVADCHNIGPQWVLSSKYSAIFIPTSNLPLILWLFSVLFGLWELASIFYLPLLAVSTWYPVFYFCILFLNALIEWIYPSTGFKVHVWSRIRTLNLKSLYGEWVVISGATDGIGLEYAKEFARRGHSVILLGRSEAKLAQAKQQVSRFTAPSKVVTIQIDFNDADSQVTRKLPSLSSLSFSPTF